jgi:8-oxo-dGTP diphosphatase
MTKQQHITVAAAIIRQGPYFLAAQRPVGGPYGGQWEFPGGKLEMDETPEAALKRELKEELNITPKNYFPVLCLEHVYPEFNVTLHVFAVNSFSGEPAALDGQTLAWLRPAEALTLPWLAADVPIVEKLAAGEF